MMQKVETYRVNLNMPCDLTTRVDEYANRMNINRTSAICVLLNQALDNQKAITTLDELLNVFHNQDISKQIVGN